MFLFYFITIRSIRHRIVWIRTLKILRIYYDDGDEKSLARTSVEYRLQFRNILVTYYYVTEKIK